jgi:hypothetical protein
MDYRKTERNICRFKSFASFHLRWLGVRSSANFFCPGISPPRRI